MQLKKEWLQFGALTSLGISSIIGAHHLSSLLKKTQNHTTLFKEAPFVATAALGHTEFGWTIAALQGLAYTINAWSSEDYEQIDAKKKDAVHQQFDHFYEQIDSLAAAQIGMREVFTYPASYLAFERNDLEKAVRIAELGAQDQRLTADLALVIAYLKHLFSDDLNQVADAYERVLEAYPQAEWLDKTIQQLRSGVDPMLRSDKDHCRKLLIVFPKAKRRLVERGICSNSEKGVNYESK